MESHSDKEAIKIMLGLQIMIYLFLQNSDHVK